MSNGSKRRQVEKEILEDWRVYIGPNADQDMMDRPNPVYIRGQLDRIKRQKEADSGQLK